MHNTTDLLMVINKNKSAPSEISLVIDQVQKTGEVEGWVGLLVNMGVPVFIMHSLRQYIQTFIKKIFLYHIIF